MRAYQIQRERFKNSKTKFNGQMTEKEIEKYCPLVPKAKELLERAMTGSISAEGPTQGF
jgi:magnesium chelatase family protein